MKTGLTKEQSQRLIELGVERSKASMIRLDFNGTYAYVSGEETDIVRACVNAEYYVEECEVFSLSDILSLLPKEITKKLDGEVVRFQLYLYIYEEKWCVGYGENERERPKDRFFDDSPWLNLTWIWRPELIDALYELLCWTLTRDKE